MSFSNILKRIMKEENVSQEEFAEIFGISADCLTSDCPKRATHRVTEDTKDLPDYESYPDWEFYPSAIMDEYRQSEDEGLDMAEYQDLFKAVAGLKNNKIKKDMGDVLYSIVKTTPTVKNYKYIEPSNYDEIKMLSKGKEFDFGNKAEFNKVYGAWMGRISGCMLGKTVECIKAEELKRFLKETGNFPLKRYIFKSDLEKVNLSEYKFDFSVRDYADQIECMPSDDDTNYVVIAQKVFEEYGEDFTPDNIISSWVKYQSKDAYCTAERVAFLNYVKGYRPPVTATHKNPYREWIGAQIRGDYWGYINPGNPEKAAEMAWRDASVSHVKNGIYGEMFVAAMLAAASQTNDLREIIEVGLSCIPYTSRLYEDITKIMDMYKEKKTQKEIFDYIHKRFDDEDGYDWCHTNSNAMIVAASLLCGEGDFGKSVCMAVETGFDTDCNGATVGSILGMANGIESIEKRWQEPFNDTLATGIFGVERVNIKEMAENTLKHIKKMYN